MKKRCYKLKVYPQGRGREVYRSLEICGDDTLDRLCMAILDAFEFTADHLYEFCMDNRMYSQYSYQSYPGRGQKSTNIRLDKIALTEGHKFALHYDFGDDWMFTISVMNIAEIDAYFPARVTKAKGEIVQYPDFEDWDFEDEEEDGNI